MMRERKKIARNANRRNEMVVTVLMQRLFDADKYSANKISRWLSSSWHSSAPPSPSPSPPRQWNRRAREQKLFINNHTRNRGRKSHPKPWYDNNNNIHNYDAQVCMFINIQISKFFLLQGKRGKRGTRKALLSPVRHAGCSKELHSKIWLRRARKGRRHLMAAFGPLEPNSRFFHWFRICCVCFFFSSVLFFLLLCSATGS